MTYTPDTLKGITRSWAGMAYGRHGGATKPTIEHLRTTDAGDHYRFERTFLLDAPGQIAINAIAALWMTKRVERETK